jgi:hypothetical protein
LGELSIGVGTNGSAANGSAANGSRLPFWIDSRAARFALISLILFLA